MPLMLIREGYIEVKADIEVGLYTKENKAFNDV